MAPLVLTARTRTLMIVPILLAIATGIALFVHSDVNTPMLWSQCHAHARLPGLSRVPLLGTPLCYVVSFFHAALDSARTRAVLAVVLAFVGALLTVCTAESARGCNRPARLVANPTPAWLLFNLLGGALVWQLLIVPAQIQRLRNIFVAQKIGAAGDEEEGGEIGGQRLEALGVDLDRNLAASEVVAIPVSIVLGFYLPSVLMLVFNSPATIGVWLFFPLYVSLARQAVRWALQRVWSHTAERNVHLETHRRSLVAVYGVPALSSVLAHAGILWSLTRPDDRREMTRSCVKFIEIDFAFIGATVLYWVLVETNWKVPAYMVGISALLGPGAGTLAGWLLREKVIQEELGAVIDLVAGEEAADEPSEQTPLL
ncbi:hypothetical protein CCM_02527 [Cordyceps militaris CM01]|uniref:Corticosteroid-binding protein n=2 Tax=Cordyceps militaris TaxID=73501 RepID=G3JA86_CORMM|nr:uncharacterized protein CCM_02527 [Cordyceps militaris CM01]ATY60099.1 hypothetical protein A9K55_006394 [Cordyceps militaris]EGX94256.1 hypothetical protein CCM_02527 [Cordyceps militaris CM01]